MKNTLTILKTLHEAGYEAVIAGGAVRDKLLGLTPHDFDIATSATPMEVEELFEKTLPHGKAFGVVVVMMPGMDPYEVATFREDGEYLDGRRPSTVEFSNMEEDAKRRDFTINAMFWNPLKDEVIDLVGGKEDLKNKVLRFVGDPEERIIEDKLRLLRAVRFAVKFDFTMEEETFKAVTANAPKVAAVVSAERIQEELTKLFMLGKPREALDLLLATGLLHEVLPEVEALVNTPQNPKWHPEGSVFQHTIMVMEALDVNTSLLVWSALLHDIGKPETTFVDEEGVIKATGHENVGAELAEKMLRRLKFSNFFVGAVKALVADHMRVKYCVEMRKSKLKKLLAQENLLELKLLGKADSEASTGMLEWYEFLKKAEETFEPEEIRPDPLITGAHLIKLGFTPGPLFKEILDNVSTRQLEEELTTETEALEFVTANWSIK